MREGLGFHFDIEVNGCCNERTYAELIGMGADTLVMGGSGLFSKSGDVSYAVRIASAEALESVDVRVPRP